MGSQYPCTFTLRWALTGELIKHRTELQDVGVEQLCQHLDEGIYEEYGVPRTDPQAFEGFTGYVLIYDGVELQDGQHFSDYAIPHNATINVVLKHFYYETTD